MKWISLKIYTAIIFDFGYFVALTSYCWCHILLLSILLSLTVQNNLNQIVCIFFLIGAPYAQRFYDIVEKIQINSQKLNK